MIDVKMLAEVLAIQAEIEGMKTSNKASEYDKNPPYFDFYEFQDKAQRLRDLVNKQE